MHVCTPITLNRPSICKWASLHVCVLKAVSLMSQMLAFCQNNLLGIFMSCTRTQLGYRWGERGGGGGEWSQEGLNKSGTPDPRRTKPCSGPKTPRELDLQRGGWFWMDTAIILMIVFLIVYSMFCVSKSTALATLWSLTFCFSSIFHSSMDVPTDILALAVFFPCKHQFHSTLF